MSSRLCLNCQKISFDPNLKTLTQSQWDLGTFGELRRRECPFCKLVASICTKSAASWEAIKRFDDLQAIQLRFNEGEGFDIPESPLGSFICIAADPTDCNEREQTGTYLAREVFDQWIDFDDVNRWISTCDRKHGRECTSQVYNPAVLPRNSTMQLDFRLIDVHDMCIAYAPRSCRYIALSYVWGKADDNRLLLNHNNEDFLMQPGALSEAQASIPNKILDAMAVTRKLHERYLWVYSLCLLQDDPDELRECTAIMDLFYEMAILTIIAGSGSDAHADFLGVQPRLRKVSRLVEEIIPGLKMTTTVNLETVLRKSFYSTRAWTMQEEILSNRLLIFINDQIYFRCPCVLYSEEQNWRGKRLFDSSQGGRYDASLYRRIFSEDYADFVNFSTMILYYTQRKLSFPTDVLRATQGMLRRYSILSGVHVFEGMPPPFEQSFMFKKHSDVSETASGRQEGFPSYSWTGWKQCLDWLWAALSATVVINHKFVDANDLKHKAYLGTWILWHCKLENGKIYSISNSGRLRRARTPPSSEESRLNSSPAFQQISISISDTDFSTVRIGDYPLLLFWTVCINLKLTKSDVGWDACDKNDRHCGMVQLDAAIPENTREGKFAILAETKDGFWALLLKWKDGITERRGQAHLPTNILKNSPRPGPRWKAIILG